MATASSCSRGDAITPSMKASFAKELPSIQEPDHSLLALW